MLSLKTIALAFAALAAPCIAQCPAQVGVPNGGFECGTTAPWYMWTTKPAYPNVTIAAPGYKSQFAVKFEFGAAKVSYFRFINPDIGQQCQGYYYRVSFALNWDTYAGPPSTDSVGCKLDVDAAYCFGDIVGNQTVYATPGAGWGEYSFTCLAMQTGEGSYTIEVGCDDNSAFDFEMDALDIKLLGTSP